MWKLWHKLLFGAGVLLTIFAVYLLVGPDSRKTALLKRLDAEGLVAQAKVIEKHVEEHVSYDDSGSRAGRRSVGVIIRDHDRRAESATVEYLYYVDVEFKTAQGQTVRSKKDVLGQHFDGIKVGAQVPILYHPEAPSEVSRLRDHGSPYRDISELFRIMAMFMLSIAAMLFWFGRPRGGAGDDAADREWQNAATARIANFRDARDVQSQAAARNVAANRSSAPRGFGQPRRRAQKAAQ
jgi:hypothetical protein